MGTEITEAQTALERAAETPLVEAEVLHEDVGRLFQEALERRSGRSRRRPQGMRLSAILLAVMACLVAALGVGAWPGLWSHFHAGVGHPVAARPVPASTVKRAQIPASLSGGLGMGGSPAR